MNSNSLLARGVLAATTVLAAAGAASAIDIDLREVESPQAAVATAFAHQRLATLAPGEPVSVLGLPVGDAIVDLHLEQFTVWTDDGVFLVDDLPQPRPSITLLRGTVAGDEDSRVVVGIGAHATNGFIQTGGTIYSISSGGVADGQPAEHADLMIADLADTRVDPTIPACALDDTNFVDFAPMGQPVYDGAQIAQNRGTVPCRVVRVAIDSDFEWLSERFGGNAAAGAEYSLFLMAAISEVYSRDVNVQIAVPFLRMYSSNTDPYNGTTTPDPLIQVRDHWRAAMQHVDRDLVHLFTGANTSYGGVAYLSVMCNDQWGFGVSSYMDGAFPYPLQQNSGGNWDLVVVSHELGHNFGTLHTHDGYTPPIDNCGQNFQDGPTCVGNLNGTIMSYCHVCPGGLPNIDLRFHPRVQDQITTYLANDAPCNLEPAAGAFNDNAQAIAGQPTDIFVLANDRGPNCQPVGLASVQSPTANGGTATIAGWNNPTGDPTGFFVRYTPSAGQQGTDSFSYTTTSGQSATVNVDIIEFRDPDFAPSQAPGLEAAWYAIPAGTAVVPDFAGLTPLDTGIATDINFPSTGGPAVGGPLSDNIGAVFEGYLVAPADGVYSLELESDDGSLLYIGDELVVDNNGLHGMVTSGGAIGLKAGTHSLRIEFFEAGGGAGLIFRWNGPGGAGVVPQASLVYSDPTACIADLVAPFGVLDLGDINYFVGQFVFNLPDADIAEPIGVWDLADIVLFIDVFSSGCP